MPIFNVDTNLGFKLHTKSLCLLDKDYHKNVMPNDADSNQDKPKKDKRTISVTECKESIFFF